MEFDTLSILSFILALMSAIILFLKEWDLIKRSWVKFKRSLVKFKMLFKVYILWSKKDRIKAMELRKEYQLSNDVWVKDKSEIVFARIILTEKPR